MRLHLILILHEAVTLLHFLQLFVVSYLRLTSSLLLSRLSVAIEFGRLSSKSTCTVCCSASAFRCLSSSSSSTCIGCSASACLSSSPTWTCMACWRCCVSATKVGCLSSSTCIACGVSAVEVGRLVLFSDQISQHCPNHWGFLKTGPCFYI